ncbi:MAG: Gfo/Idh/MocA family oxidoreductase [Ardenticatenaceae bacterium]|nr:Gfo/Idh/MocA family oxidoreductase [Ardenticatenaceae bacterium]
MTKLRVGVIGLGMGKGHIRGYATHPQAEVVAIADLNEQVLATVGDEYGINGRYTSAEQMLAEANLDVVSIATPNKFHKAYTLAAFAAGCHVLCEKPMAMNAAEGREMLAAAEQAGKRLMINFSYRFSEPSFALKAQVDSGILGDIYFARTVWHRRRGIPRFGGWFGQKALSGGGPLIDLGVHRLDLALWLMGYPQPTWVMASAYNPIATRLAMEAGVAYDVEDMAVALIKFANGATVEVEASWATNIREAELMETRLLGTKAGLVQRNVNEGYQFEAELYVENAGYQFDMKVHPPLKPVPNSMNHFVESIVTDTPHIATGEEGLLVMQLLDAIYESAATGAPVQI